MLRRVALLRTDFSEERFASIIRVTRIIELGMLGVTSSRSTQRGGSTFFRNVCCYKDQAAEHQSDKNRRARNNVSSY
jgi:hypothetical protein